jgi:hypothetical protein
MCEASAATGATWSTLQIHGMYTMHIIEFDPDDGTMWSHHPFDGDKTPFELMPEVCIWEFAATVDNLIFGVVKEVGMVAGPRIMAALVSDRELAEQFVGTHIDRLYAVVGFHNNFRGIDYNDVSAIICVDTCVGARESAAAEYVFAVQDGRKWTIRTTGTPLHLLRGTILALELLRD